MSRKVCFVIFLLAFFSAGDLLAQSQESVVPDAGNDCSNIPVDYKSDPNLTRHEKVERMDRALFFSLNKYESCQSPGSSAVNAKKSGSSRAGEDGESSGSESSMASSGMSGTEPPAVQKSSPVNLGSKASKEAITVNKNTAKQVENINILSNGKIPDDIPSVDNDSVLEGQIRHAAMTETDPEIRQKLWNEYRKYKGLPVQKTGGSTP